MKRKITILATSLIMSLTLWGQTDKKPAGHLTFTGDYRFRIEQDWNSRKSDGTYRTDRTRLRYRLRFGATYHYNKHLTFGLRLRTGQLHKQQDPQLTLGAGFKEFGTLPIGLEKAYFRAKHNEWELWLGKNTFPFKKQNELFWSDNVYPEGVFASKKLTFSSKWIRELSLKLGHFILSANGAGFKEDNFFQGIQLYSLHGQNRLQLFSAFYRAVHTPNIPDGGETYWINYSFLHFGGRLAILPRAQFYLETDYYLNLEDYSKNDSIPSMLKDQKQGLILALGLGQLKEKGDWMIKLTYTHLERYAAIDFMAQNDWTRWDYSAYGSPDGRLTNFKGWEIAAGYALGPNAKLKMRFFLVEQLIPYGITTETGTRIRFDLGMGF